MTVMRADETPEARERRERKAAYDRAYYLANKERVAERARVYRQANKERIAEVDRAYRQANKERIAKRTRAYHQAHKERIAEVHRAYCRVNKERVADRQRSYQPLKRASKYGLTPEDVERMRAQQDNTCPVCCAANPTDIDHDHTTGKVRGLLCRKCNSVLGFVDDNSEILRRAIAYLERHKVFAQCA